MSSIFDVQLNDEEYEKYSSYIKQHMAFSAIDDKNYDALIPVQFTKDNFFNLSFSLDNLYWSYFYRKCIKKIANDGAAASVTIDPSTGRIILTHNKEFFGKVLSKPFSEMWALATIKHELLHIIFGHIFVNRHASPDLYFLENVAMDMAVNSLLATTIRKNTIIPGVSAFSDFKPGLGHKKYYEQLYFKCHEDKAFAKFLEMFEPQHNFTNFQNMSQQEQDALKEEVVKFIKKGGEIPPELFLTNEELSIPNIIPDNFVVLVNTLKKLGQKNVRDQSTYTVPNRYVAGLFGSKKIYETIKLYVLIDTSESIKSPTLASFYTYVALLNKFFNVVVVPFNTEALVDYIEEYPLHRFEGAYRVSSGCTNFAAPVEFIKSITKSNDIIIMFTDLEDFGKELEEKDMPRNFYFVCDKKNFVNCKKRHYRSRSFVIETSGQDT